MTNCSLVLKEQSFFHEYDCQYKPKLLAVATVVALMVMNGASAEEFQLIAQNEPISSPVFNTVTSNENVTINIDNIKNKYREFSIVSVSDLTNGSVASNEFSLVVDARFESSFSGINITKSGGVSVVDNIFSITNDSVSDGQGLVGSFNFIKIGNSTSQSGGDDSKGFSIKNNRLYISNFSETSCPLNVVSASQSSGVVSGNQLEVRNSVFKIAGVFTGGTKQQMRVTDNSALIIDSQFREAYGAYTSNTYELFSNNSLELINPTILSEYDDSSVHGQCFQGAIYVDENFENALEYGKLKIQGRLKFEVKRDKSQTVKFGGSYAWNADVKYSSVSFDSVETDLSSVGPDFLLGFAIYGGATSGSDNSLASAVENEVIVKKSTLENNRDVNIYGGKALGGSVLGNTVKVESSHIKTDTLNVYGGYAEDAGLALNNLIRLDNAEIGGESVTFIGGESIEGSAENNSIEVVNNSRINTGTLKVYGGYAEDAGLAINNLIRLDNAEINGESVTLIGGESKEGSVENNTIEIINNSRLTAKIVGSSSPVDVINSTVQIDSSIVEGDISIFDGRETTSGSGILRISGESVLERTGLHPHMISGYEGISDTELVFDGFAGRVSQIGFVDVNSQNEIQNIHAFDRIKLLNQTWSESTPIITVSNAETASVFAKSSFTDNSLSFVNPEAILPGSSITLVSVENDGSQSLLYVDPDSPDTGTLKGNAGTSTEFTGDIFFGDKEITYSIEDVEPAEQTFLVGDARAAASAFVNQGSDLLERVFHGFTLSREKYGLMTFATAEGIKSNYDMSDSLKINGWNFLAGVRSVNSVLSGDLTCAAFFEYGKGNYRTHNEHLGLSFRTDGDIEYAGGGLALRYMTEGGFYGEASVRAGQLSSDISHALMDNKGNFYDVDTDSFYAGIHVGLGKVFSITDAFEVDAYGKYFYTYTDSDDFMINSEKYSFDQISSNRFRLGARASHTKDGLTFLFGLAGEYEFSGESNMTAANTPSQTSDFGGFSAFAEAGVSLIPSLGSPWQFDLQVRGWQGTREAITGMLTINYLL